MTGLRDTRKPCHFWVDNEVADCYQAIVGADAVWVYCRIARYAHGAWIVSPKVRGDSRVSLREMAEWCGKSVDTVWRCLQVLEHVGLLKTVRGAKSKGRYALVDVKDLVTREGGLYNRELGSFQLPQPCVAELTQQVRELRLKLARKKAGVSSVAQSDSFEGSAFSAPDVECDRSVAPSDTTVAHGATDNFLLEESNTAKQTTTPQPPQAGACGLMPGEHADETKTKNLPTSVETNSLSSSKDQLATGPVPVHHDAAATRTELDRERVPADTEAPARRDCSAVQRSGGVAGEGAGLVERELDADPPLDEEQLAHLAKHANDPAYVATWTGYYREQNLAHARAAAIAAETERIETERIERLRAELADVPAAKNWVLRQCGFIERNRRRGIGDVIAAVLQQECEVGKTLLETAPEMVKAWKSYQKNGEYLRIQYGPVKFFELGIWKDWHGWAWDEAKLERERGARVGSGSWG